MDCVIFDGREFAARIEKDLHDRVVELTRQLGRRPKLVSILVGDDGPSAMYLGLKQKMAQRLGIEFTRVGLAPGDIDGAKESIMVANSDLEVDGIMVQLPVMDSLGKPIEKKTQQQVLDDISNDKDIDGLTTDSKFLPGAARSVIEILLELQDSGQISDLGSKSIVVIGAAGMVGKSVVKSLSGRGFDVIGMDKVDFDKKRLVSADIVISATGQAGLVTPDLVKEGVIAIDVGAPKGEFAPEVVGKAAFLTPVPGGVGPVTVACLFANLVDKVAS